MMRILAVLAVLCFVAPAHAAPHCNGHVGEIPTAPGVKLVCSRSWNFLGTCTDQDMVYQWQYFTSNPRFEPSWHIKPWEDQPTTIVGFTIITFADDDHDFYMVGNNYVPDPMIYLAKGQRENHLFLPPGLGWPFPSAQQAGKMDYIDLHGVCHHADANVMVTIYSTPQGAN